jgi:hypothetical protein
MMQQRSGEDYTKRSFKICTPNKIGVIKSRRMRWPGRTYGTYRTQERCIQGFGEET